MNWREDCLDRLRRSATSVDNVVKELAVIVGDLGFEYCSYVLEAPLPLFKSPVSWASTYPKRWLDHYFSHGYLHIDTLLQRIFTDQVPVAWSDSIFQSEPAFWEEARAHQIRHGWAIATYGKHATKGALSLARSTGKVTARELEEKEGKLIWLSHVAHGIISEAKLHEFGAVTRPDLTPREREVLRWTAVGKTANEISVIIGITERAIVFHIANCLDKLNASNKAQAVSIALLLGWLF